MATHGKRWIFRVQTGHIYGPFDKAKVRELLKRSMLTGDEEVAQYPAGDWRPWSSDRDLSELLMDNLAKTDVGPRPSPRPREVAREGGQQTATPASTTAVREKKTPAPPKEIVMTEEKKIRRRTNVVPLLFVLGAALLIIAGLTAKFPKRTSSISLIQPIPKAKGDPVKAEALIKQGWSYYYKDTFLNYIKAEESFVKAVEESPYNADAVTMLLMTDYELWPYARQDSRDQSVVQWLTQTASKADPYGPRRSLATASAGLMLGNQSEALSQIDSALLVQPTEGRLYALKGQNFFNTFEFEQARNYYDKAATLMTYWVKPMFMLGIISSRMGNGSHAERYLTRALQMNPGHMAARVELGVVEETFFNNTEKAKEYLLLGLNSEEKLPASTEARGRYRLALIYQKSGELSKARAEAEKSLSLVPGDPTVQKLVKDLGGDSRKVKGAPGTDKQFMELGDQYIRLKNYLAAQAQYKAAFELNPSNATAAMKAADALWHLHQPTEAIKLLEKAISVDPRLVSAYTKVSDYKTRRFDFDGAIKYLNQGIKYNPASYEIYRAFAQYFLRRGDNATAETYAKRALSMYETDEGSNEIMSKIQLAKKDVVKAVQYSRRAIELDPRSVDAQVNFAKMKAQFEGVKGGQDYLKDLINTFPSALEYRLALAEVLMQDEQYKAANQVLDQVISFDGNNKEAYMLAGDANYLNGDYDEALNRYFSAARVDPSDAAALFRAGEVYAKAGKLAEAQKQFQLVIRINPYFPRAHYSLAAVYYRSNMGDLALKELDEEKKLNPRLADPYELAGDIYLSLRKFGQATQQYQKAAELKPLGANIYVKQARAYRGQNSLDAALAMLRLAAAKESGYAEIYREQGFVFEQKGMIDEAEASLKQYLRLEPNSPDKQFILDKIKELQK